jgi:uncharacterized protein YhfF
MSRTILTDKFWREFCAENTNVNPDEPYQVWFFGNNRELAKSLADLVLAGKKTATGSLVLVNEIKPEIAPVPDGYSVVTDFEGNPQCVIQTTEIRRLPFNEVDAQFAFDEGEGDRSLEFWRKVHWDYFTRECRESGVEFNESMLVDCERFKLLFPKL